MNIVILGIFQKVCQMNTHCYNKKRKLTQNQVLSQPHSLKNSIKQKYKISYSYFLYLLQPRRELLLQ